MSSWLAMHYDLLRGLHIIGVIAWMAGMLYLPRLYVYHCGAVAGGAILGGLLGNAVSRDIDCDDQPVAFRVYADGLNGDIGRRYEWRNRGNYGYFTPTREYRRSGVVCRDFTETSYRGGQSYTRSGTACREVGGNWRFD